MAEYDLTRTIVPYLDRHLAFPLLAHLADTELFNPEDVQAAQYELARGTNMVDYAVSLFEQLHPDEEVPQEFAGKREKAVQMNERLQGEAQAVLDVIENPDVAQSLKQDKQQNLQYLKDNYNLTLDQITALYTFGQFQYSYGNYSGAADYLYHFRVLSTDTDLSTSSTWGKLACDILTGKWDIALEELLSLRDALDARATDARAQLHARTWLIHWLLFVAFNHPAGRVLLLETALAPAYLSTIQTACPWVLRYLCAAAILAHRAQPVEGADAVPPTNRTKHALKEVTKIVQAEAYQYADPLTDFLRMLYVEFDFVGAREELGKVAGEGGVCEGDFFLGDWREEIVECARGLVSEVYCRIHQRIDIADLSERLNLSPDEGEKWIVNLIRETRMGHDAKIDLEKNVITISRPPLPMYQTIIEKTRGLAYRTQVVGTTIAKAGQVPQEKAAEVEVGG